jgi:o-succinylbenzoate synthase
MKYTISYTKHRLKFKFRAGTSRGILTERDCFLISISKKNAPTIIGIGEASPLRGLSIEYGEGFEKQVDFFCKKLTSELNEFADIYTLIPSKFPSLRFAFETALLDLQHGGKRLIFKNEFSQNEKGIPINGLVWMGDEEFMQKQIEAKLEQGFTCIKMKIGAIDFETEFKLLTSIRKKYTQEQITLRVDANGAFSFEEAKEKLARLAKLGIHSIEQPIMAGQIKAMRELCQQNPLDIALDEELIGITDLAKKRDLLHQIKPQYIILKPTLLGGIAATKEWIQVAESMHINWWITSALESNIGLNAIAQFTAQYPVKIPQGLGTGQLYQNNIDSNLLIKEGQLFSVISED